VAHLSGFTVSGVKGDAVIIEGSEPSVQLDQHLNNAVLGGEEACDHRALAAQVIGIIQKLGQAKLGHADLHLGNFLLHDGRLFLLDGYAVHRGGMTMKDVLLLGHSVARFATRTDILRAWRTFSSAGLPRRNPARPRLWRKLLQPITSENAYFGRLRLRLREGDSPWVGHFFKHGKFPRRWAPASRIDVTIEDWQREWPKLLARLEADELEVIKRSRSGDVLAGEVTLAGRSIRVVIKRPRRRNWRRRVAELGRGGRARRAWRKSWALIARDIPTAWPLLLMQRRRLGYLVDAVIVFERVEGTLLCHLDLATLSKSDRTRLFHRLGRTLRLLEAQGLSQYDSKTTNWIIVSDPVRGPTPIVIDVDGIRRTVPPLWPIDRLLRSLRDHPQYTPEDSRWVCIGYAPFAHLMEETIAN
jgi:tRNA A-37 threonylcarbamoyl transferase component Bud32